MLAGVEDADTFVLIPPPIQGIGNASGFTMQIELRNGDFDYPLLESLARTIVADGNAQSGCGSSTPRSGPACRRSRSRWTGSRPRPSA